MRRLLQRVALYAFHLCFTRPVMHWVVGIRYRRRILVPKGPCLVVSNHNSHLDAAVLLTMFPLRRLARVHPVAAADYFGSNWLKRTMAMLFMNAIPIKRRPTPGEDPLTPLTNALKAGESLIFFPEGSRGKAGVVAPFRRGVGLLLREVPGLLVVPVFLSGPERIWPRGEFVPVPLSIDANIGRPRTYPATADSRAIAEQIRRDVLALAPPPPPVPGRGPQPPVRVAVCSADDGYRRDVFRAITSRLGKLEPTLGVGEPVLEAGPDGLRETTGPVAVGRRRAWLRLLAWLFHIKGRFKGKQFVKVVERAQLDEALNHGSEIRFVALEASPLVELIAFSASGEDGQELPRLISYLTGKNEIPMGIWWSFIRRDPAVWLINVLDLAQPPAPDLVVHLRRPIPRLMEQLRSKGTALEPFQTPAHLERLQETYRRLGEHLQADLGVEWLDIDASEQSSEAIAEQVEAICRRLTQQAS